MSTHKPSERRNVTNPADWWIAFERAATAAQMSLSDWVGEACRKHLPPDARKKLSERRGPGQPPKPETDAA